MTFELMALWVLILLIGMDVTNSGVLKLKPTVKYGHFEVGSHQVTRTGNRLRRPLLQSKANHKSQEQPAGVQETSEKFTFDCSDDPKINTNTKSESDQDMTTRATISFKESSYNGHRTFKPSRSEKFIQPEHQEETLQREKNQRLRRKGMRGLISSPIGTPGNYQQSLRPNQGHHILSHSKTINSDSDHSINNDDRIITIRRPINSSTYVSRNKKGKRNAYVRKVLVKSSTSQPPSYPIPGVGVSPASVSNDLPHRYNLKEFSPSSPNAFIYRPLASRPYSSATPHKLDESHFSRSTSVLSPSPPSYPYALDRSHKFRNPLAFSSASSLNFERGASNLSPEPPVNNEAIDPLSSSDDSIDNLSYLSQSDFQGSALHEAPFSSPENTTSEAPDASVDSGSFNIEVSEIGEAAYIVPESDGTTDITEPPYTAPRKSYGLTINDGQVIRNEVRNSDGEFLSSFTSADGTSRTDMGMLVPKANGDQVLILRGSYSFTSPEGLKFRVDYTADENGYQPTNVPVPNNTTDINHLTNS